jgi:cytochrome c oxidase assembly protein subunit 11
MWIYRVRSCISIFFRLSYLLVPIYDRYCQRTGFGGTLSNQKREWSVFNKNQQRIRRNPSSPVRGYWIKDQGVNFGEIITIDFHSEVSTSLQTQTIPSTLEEINTKETTLNLDIEFKPQIKKINTRLGKPTLAFYKIKNLTENTIHGIRTYNVTPRKAGQYFHKLECFCFDEQRIKANETLELPILFYIDPLILKEDRDIKQLSINYTFYKSQDMA